MQDRNNEWIKCEDSLPEREVLAVNTTNDYMIGYVVKGKTIGDSFCGTAKTNYLCSCDYETLPNVTHWMYLPSPPKN